MKYTIQYFTKDTNGNVVKIGSDVRPDNTIPSDKLLLTSLHSLVCKYVKETEQLSGTQARKDAYALVYRNGVEMDTVYLPDPRQQDQTKRSSRAIDQSI